MQIPPQFASLENSQAGDHTKRIMEGNTRMDVKTASTAKKVRTCRCGHTRDNFWVSAQARYSTYGFIMGVFMGLSGTLPKSIRFKCRKCGEVIEERYDKATLKAYREH